MSRAIRVGLLFCVFGLLAGIFAPRTGGLRAGVPPELENQNPDSTILVVPMDGRPVQEVPRVHIGAESYVPLGGLACALGVSFAWNPFSYQGWIATDSLHTTFILDSPVLNHGDEAIQIEAPIGYDEHGVLIPLDYLTVLTERWHGERTVTWRPGAAILHWGSDMATFRQLRIAQAGRQSVLKIPMRGSPKGQSLLWSPVGRLEILLDGVSVSPESLAIRGTSRGEGLLVRSVACMPEGCRIRLDIGRGILGASAGFDAREGAWELSTTGSREEIARGGFRGLRQAERSGWDVGRTSGPVVITSFVDFASDPVEADSALDDLADRIARTLADTLLVNAEVVIPRDPLDAARSVNASRARCVIGLRLDRYATDTGKLQVWSATPRLRWEPVDLTQSLEEIPPRPLLWSETPALSEDLSRRIATTLASHLATLVGEDRVESGSRPSRWLEGFTMPAVMIYPAQANDRLSLERLMDGARRVDLARAIAFGIAEAIEESGNGPLGISGPIRPLGRLDRGPDR